MTRIVSWNMQGAGPGANKWSADVSRLFSQAGADLVCLQECGVVPQAAQAAQFSSLNSTFPCAAFTWNIGSSNKSWPLSIFWLKTRMGGNLAIVGDQKYFSSQPVLVTRGDSGLLALGIVFNVSQGGMLNVYTSNTFFGGGQEDAVLLEQIANTPKQGTWFAVGDFNQEPMAWVWNQDLVPTKSMLYCGHPPVTVFPGAGTNLDYAFIGPGQAPQGSTVKAVQGVVDSTYSSSDHFPVFYDVPYDLSS